MTIYVLERGVNVRRKGVCTAGQVKHRCSDICLGERGSQTFHNTTGRTIKEMFSGPN